MQHHRPTEKNHAHPALQPERVAVVTGAAMGIGFAIATRLAKIGMKLVLADVDGAALTERGAEIAALLPHGERDLRLVQVDVANPADMLRLRDAATEAFDDVALLVNNAALGHSAGPWDNPDVWRRLLEVNFFGVLHAQQAFVPTMLAHGRAAAIVNVGSKQGITTPPGNAAYNVSKAAVRVLTEQLAHQLRQIDACPISAHLLIPGYTFTPMNGQIDADTPKPADAWTAEQVSDFLLDGLAEGTFYLLCPDNAVPRAVDEKRMAWAMGDLIENRPPLSRWHPDYAEQFARFMKG